MVVENIERCDILPDDSQPFAVGEDVFGGGAVADLVELADVKRGVAGADLFHPLAAAVVEEASGGTAHADRARFVVGVPDKAAQPVVKGIAVVVVTEIAPAADAADGVRPQAVRGVEQAVFGDNIADFVVAVGQTAVKAAFGGYEPVEGIVAEGL